MAFHNVPPNGFPDLPDVEELEAVVKDVTTLKTSVSGLSEDVSDLEDQKANQITIAPAFNAETTYEVGDLVYYNGLSYRCTTEHTGEWDADDFTGTTIENELASLKSGLTTVVTVTPTTELTGVTCSKCGAAVVVDLSNAQRTYTSGYIVTGLPKPTNTIAVGGYNGTVFTLTTDGKLYSDAVTDKWDALHIAYLTND